MDDSNKGVPRVKAQISTKLWLSRSASYAGNVFGKSDEELICRMLRRGLHIQGRCLILSEGYEMWEAFLHDVPI